MLKAYLPWVALIKTNIDMKQHICITQDMLTQILSLVQKPKSGLRHRILTQLKFSSKKSR